MEEARGSDLARFIVRTCGAASAISETEARVDVLRRRGNDMRLSAATTQCAVEMRALVSYGRQCLFEATLSRTVGRYNSGDNRCGRQRERCRGSHLRRETKMCQRLGVLETGVSKKFFILSPLKKKKEFKRTSHTQKNLYAQRALGDHPFSRLESAKHLCTY